MSPKRHDRTVVDATGKVVDRPDSTVLYDSNAGQRAQPGPAGRLLVIAGPKKGTEHALVHAETSIGRSGDNTWVIPDISVSRRHLLVRKTAIGFAASDLKSGNGTMVNGALLQGERLLQDGDEIELGDTVLRYQGEGGGRRSAVVVSKGRGPKTSTAKLGDLPHGRRHKPSLSYQQKAIVGLAAVVLSLGVAAAVKSRMGEDGASGPSREELGNQALEDGLALYKAEKFEDARTRFTEAVGLLGEDEEAKRALAATEREIAGRKQLEVAEQALKANRHRDAMVALSKVAGDSLLQERVAEVQKKVREALGRKVKDARARLSVGDVGGAREIILAVVEADPANQEAGALRAEIEEKEGAVKEELAEREKVRQRLIEKAARNRALLPLVEAQEAFMNADAAEALQRAQACSGSGGVGPKCRALANDIKGFQKSYQAGMEAARDKRMSVAIQSLTRARDLHKRIVEGPSRLYSSEIGKYLGNLHYQTGMQAKSQDLIAKAMKAFQSAIAADPQHSLARQQLAELKDAAHNLFLQAYVDQATDPEKARKECYEVLEMTARGDPDRAKCQKIIDKIERGIGGN
jgi:pSer/pThr/pTyr-binding forkhead associated (FHA) protein